MEAVFEEEEPRRSTDATENRTTPSRRQPSESPLRLSRPRSNPRTRTPMRYESPLNADAFRRERILEEEAEENERRAAAADADAGYPVEGRRVTIRLGTGQAVGTTARVARTLDARGTRATRGKSPKQRPGQRKTRRYLNENFVNLAAELARSSAKGRTAAEVLIKAQQDAPMYRSVYNPEDHQSAKLNKFMHDSSMQGLRDKFFSCELSEQPKMSKSRKVEQPCATPEDMMNRINPRLRRIVVKACTNSFPASKVVESFEDYIVATFAANDASALAAWTENLNDILSEPPTVVHKHDGNGRLIRFRFRPASSTGGFHRLLLHAVCEFHGLKARSSTVQASADGDTTVRVLTATGNLIGEGFKLVDEAMRRSGVSPSVSTSVSVPTSSNSNGLTSTANTSIAV